MSTRTATDWEMQKFAPIMLELLEWLIGKKLSASEAVSIIAGAFMLMFASAPKPAREMILSVAQRMVADCEKHMDETEVREILHRLRLT